MATIPQEKDTRYMVSEARSSRTPKDRLTRICDQMTRTFDTHPEYHEGDRCIVLLDDGKMGGIVLHGYQDEKEAVIDLFLHLRAIFKAQGMDLDFITIPKDASNAE
jgi:hypothetical protein